MAKYINIISGELEQVQAIATSAGAGDAGKLVELDVDGKFDASVMPTLDGSWPFELVKTVDSDGFYTDINTALAGVADGSQLFLGVGTFIFTDTVFYSKSLAIRGAGKGLSIISKTADGSGISTNGSSKLSDFMLEIAYAGDANLGLYFTGAQNLLERVKITTHNNHANQSSALIATTGNTRTSAYDSYFTSANDGAGAAIAVQCNAGVVQLFNCMVEVPVGQSAIYAAASGAIIQIYGGDISGNVDGVAGAIIQLFGPRIDGIVSPSSCTMTGDYYNAVGEHIFLAETSDVPFIVASTTKVDNLNADLLDGIHAANLVPGGIWLHASNGIAVQQSDLPTANTAAATDDVITIGALTSTLTAEISAKNVAYKGLSPEESIITMADDDERLFNILSVTSTRFENLTFVHTGAGSLVELLSMSSASGVRIRNCLFSKISGAPTIAMGLSIDAGDIHLIDCIFNIAAGTTKWAIYQWSNASTVIIEGGEIQAGNIQCTPSGSVLELRGPKLASGVTISGAGTIRGWYLNTAGDIVIVPGSTISANQLKSIVATGTAPLVVASTTKVANLNADLLDGAQGAAAATINTLALRDGLGDVTARLFRPEFNAAAASFNFVNVQNLRGSGVDNYIRSASLEEFMTRINMGLEKIGTVTLGANGWIAWTGLTLDDYNAALIVGNVRTVASGSGSDNLLIRFNSSGGTAYYSQWLLASGAVASAGTFPNLAWGLITNVSDVTLPHSGFWCILTASRSGMHRFWFGGGFNMIPQLLVASGRWAATTQVTRIDLFGGGGANLSTSSTATLYGIR